MKPMPVEEQIGIPVGFCQCGCGAVTQIAIRNRKDCGWIKGEPRRFVGRHNMRVKNHPSWNGGKSSLMGYPQIRTDHPRANKGYVFEHILIAEKALGKPLPPGAVVHHANGTRNSGTLVICQDEAYHQFLHHRMRALKECGHADWRKCQYCHQYDDPQNMCIQKIKRGSAFHKKCRAKYELMRKRRCKEAKSVDIGG